MIIIELVLILTLVCCITAVKKLLYSTWEKLSFICSEITLNDLNPSFPIFYGSLNGIKNGYNFDISEEYYSLKKKITAVLGPTNTGKTFLAIETMLSFDSGMIGFPLRLLAREVYDKIIKKINPNNVALITGEEKIIPSNAKYYLCTVESMPIDKNLEFVGIDEIQMCADHERGHIFTDRLLNLRGEKLTMLMGSNTIKNIIILFPHLSVLY